MSMLAARVTGPGSIATGTTDIPVITDGQVLVRTGFASLCGSDLHVVDGASSGPTFPWGYPGHEAVGVVVESRSAQVSIGAHVLCVPPANVAAAFAEYQAIDERYALLLPKCGATDRELLMAQQFGTVLFADRFRSVSALGRTVAVLGLGSAGLFWSFWLKRVGAASVIGVDPSPTRRRVAPLFGVDVVLDSEAEGFEEAVLGACRNRGADIVVEAVGSPSTTALSVRLAAQDGEVVWFGLPTGDSCVHLPYDLFFRKRLTARSSYGAQDESGASSFRAALGLIAAGAIDVQPLLNEIVPLQDIASAFALARDPVASGALKITISFDDHGEHEGGSLR